MMRAKAFGKVLSGLDVTYPYNGNNITQNVQFHYGSQKELNAFISAKQQNNEEPVPLIWYVRDTYTEHNGWSDVRARFILFMSTEPFWFNDTRTDETYTKVLEPLFIKFKERLLSNPYIQVLGDTNKKFDALDEPNFGVSTSDNSDFTNTSPKEEKGITIIPVDAKVVDCHVKINTECIINNN